MYQVIAHFSYQNFEQDPVTLISQVLNQWLYNGQVIGREMPITFHQTEFQVRVCTSEQESLLACYNSEEVNEALQQAAEAGVQFKAFEIVGQDYQAEETSKILQPVFQILYTTHLDTCSPLFDGESFAPIPLYRLKNQSLSESLLNWQQNWQACDQLQMKGQILEFEALNQISNENSPLSKMGLELCKQIEKKTKIPTFYYLYRLGSDFNEEYNRKCPSCNGDWKLPVPLHNIFHFKCERCRLISNLSWELL
ncbi:Zn-ribbon-containing protein [Mannheimia sp. AT1]|uniref:Zn-ribbon-containing protein n=1 Tax=Mannheimia cairinae TaxID=3025936 RepID=A0ABT5MRV1_9PAST|nr:Zn-ribbon-containing protein [Mannheimia cairinae]MDD0826156.1 Zn-ribbon-containing protein [Mannheimia cairinae]